MFSVRYALRPKQASRVSTVLEVAKETVVMVETVCTRAVRKVSSHFEYLENRLCGLDVAWQPVQGDLTVHPGTVTLPWG